MTQGLSIRDPSLSPTHLSIRTGRTTTTHYAHIRLAWWCRTTLTSPFPGVTHWASLWGRPQRWHAKKACKKERKKERKKESKWICKTSQVPQKWWLPWFLQIMLNHKLISLWWWNTSLPYHCVVAATYAVHPSLHHTETSANHNSGLGVTQVLTLTTVDHYPYGCADVPIRKATCHAHQQLPSTQHVTAPHCHVPICTPVAQSYATDYMLMKSYSQLHNRNTHISYNCRTQ